MAATLRRLIFHVSCPLPSDNPRSDAVHCSPLVIILFAIIIISDWAERGSHDLLVHSSLYPSWALKPIGARSWMRVGTRKFARICHVLVAVAHFDFLDLWDSDLIKNNDMLKEGWWLVGSWQLKNLLTLWRKGEMTYWSMTVQKN